MTDRLDTHAAIVGSSGAGKTVTAKADVEELLRQRRHVAIVDPTGVWYGLRSNATGDGPGFDIPIFGGLHGDVPISPRDGEAVAAIIADQRVSAIVDLSGMADDAEQRTFMLDFMRRLRAKEQANFHLVLDEADEFCPQTAPDDIGFALTRQLVWVAKRGRVAGFVLTAITQRPADVSKAVLSQVQTLVAHQLVAPQDQQAIDGYLKANGSKATRDQVMSSLAGLQRGERWVYSPRLGILERGITLPITTFDSSRTPAPGEARAEPRMLGSIDVEAIRRALAKTASAASVAAASEAYRSGQFAGDALVERDNRIAELETEVARLRAEVDELVGVDEECDRYNFGVGTAIKLLEGLQNGREASEMIHEGAFARDGGEVMLRELVRKPVAPSKDEKVASGAGPIARGAPKASAGGAPKARPPAGIGRPGGLAPSALDMLSLLKGMAPDGMGWAELALRSVRMPHGGSMNGAKKSLRDGGWVEERDGLVYATSKATGDDQIGYGQWHSSEELRGQWGSTLGIVCAGIIDHLADIGGRATPKAIGEAIGRASHGGSWNGAVKALRVAGVATREGDDMVLHPVLLDGEATNG